MIGLTPRQNELLAFISAFKAERGRQSPSLSEMAAHMGLSTRGSARRLVVELEGRGVVRRLKHRARSIEIVGGAERAVTIKPRLWPAVRRYAAKHHLTLDQAVNCIVSDYLEAA